MKTHARHTAIVASTALALTLVSCSPPPPTADEVAAERKTLLADYLASEEASMAYVLKGQADMYSDALVDGRFEGNPRASKFPTAVATFTYTYRNDVHFDEPSSVPAPSWIDRSNYLPSSVRDQMESAMLEACDNFVFPAMRAAGLIGPLRVEYVYKNPGGWGTISWSATCRAPAA